MSDDFAASWGDPARPGALGVGYVDIWRIDLRQMASFTELMARFLTEGERARARRFKKVADYRAFILTRGLLRQLLSAYLSCDGAGVAPQAVEIIRGTRGKPELVASQAGATPAGQGGLEFSVSHAGEVALLAFGRRGALGVDVEAIRPRKSLELLVRHHFSPFEAAAVLGASKTPGEASAAQKESARLRTFYRIWTRKEAYIKALGEGLAVDLQSFAARLEPRASLLWSARDDAQEWEVIECNPRPGYVGALCIARENKPVPPDYLRTMTATVSNSASVQLVL